MTIVEDAENRSNTVATGLAMFSMFFGAGNVIFPLALGQYAQHMNIYAIPGFLLTAVGVPFLGLMAVTLFDGNYNKFFDRIGHWPGFALSTAIIALIGPFGALPRTITVSHAAIKTYLPLDLWVFSAFACVIIFVLTFRKSRLLDVLGYVLTPVLLGSLGLIIVGGLWWSQPAPESSLTALTAIYHGLTQGYQTMDLLGAFFFSSVVLDVLERGIPASDKKSHGLMIVKTLKAGCIGISLLGLVYGGFSFVTAAHSGSLQGLAPEEVLAGIALHVLGPNAGIIACVAVALACLTTAIALTAVFSEFLHETLFKDRVAYHWCLVATLVTSYFVSTLDFNGIAVLLTPILVISYPALIVLSLLNIAYKLWDFKPVKGPVAVVFGISLAMWIWDLIT